MKKSLSKSLRPSLETLEGRLVPAIIGTWNSDKDLTAFVRQTASGEQVVIDGSDFNDLIQILKFDRASGVMEIKLEQWSGGILSGTRIGPSRLVRLHGLNLQASDSIVVEGKLSNDRIANFTSASMLAFGGPGRDLMYGGSAIDHMFGNEDNDTLNGFAGDDVLIGDNGDNDPNVKGRDLLQGSLGNDMLLGEAGDDLMTGGSGADTLGGGLGNDRLQGGDDDDLLFGEAGNDTLWGNGGYDRLFGGDNDDQLDAGYKVTPNLNYAEYLEGGPGADTFVRHKRLFGSNDPDIFADYNSGTGDRIMSFWHW